MSSQRTRRARAQRDRRATLERLAWRPRLCEIRWDDRCQGAAIDAHERLTRARGGDATAGANIVLGCRHCHDQVHAHPAEAAARGFLAHSWDR